MLSIGKLSDNHVLAVNIQPPLSNLPPWQSPRHRWSRSITSKRSPQAGSKLLIWKPQRMGCASGIAKLHTLNIGGCICWGGLNYGWIILHIPTARGETNKLFSTTHGVSSETAKKGSRRVRRFSCKTAVMYGLRQNCKAGMVQSLKLHTSYHIMT